MISVSGESCLPGLQLTTFSHGVGETMLCVDMVFPCCVYGMVCDEELGVVRGTERENSDVSPYKDTNPVRLNHILITT